MTNVPEDVLANIFVRLRAKQLVQMRCLSTSWKSLLSESFFIKSHLDRSVNNNNNDGTLLVWSELDSLTALAHHSQSSHLEVTDSIKLPAIPQSKDSRGRVIGSLNGLICFEYSSLEYSNANNLWNPYHFNRVVYIWNPYLSTVISLPPYSVISDCAKSIKINNLRFGFDPKTDDYKVVNLAQAYTRDLVKLQVEIYSMRKGSCELINQEIPSNLKWVKDKDQIVDGHLHWLANGWDFVESILAFDLGAETFREILLPDSLRKFKATSHYIGVLMRKLCVMSAFHRGECEVWVMEEYGVAESWVKYHVLPSFSGINIRPYGFTSNNEFLFRVLPHGLGLYDPVTAMTKLLKLRGGCDEVDRAVEHVNSLVWVTPVK